jgi:molybdopterin molybdotransferase
MSKMLKYKDALHLIRSNAEVLPVENVELQQCLQRILAADVFSDADVPPFNKSAMDGYACRKADLENLLEVIETVYAGKLPEKDISNNQCCKIMTGAVVPAGADYVFKKEDAELTAEGRVRCLDTGTANHICYKGEDIKSGDKILGKATLIAPRHLPLLAGAGVTWPLVYKLPEVAVFATGTELVEPAEKPNLFKYGTQIRPS